MRQLLFAAILLALPSQSRANTFVSLDTTDCASVVDEVKAERKAIATGPAIIKPDAYRTLGFGHNVG